MRRHGNGAAGRAAAGRRERAERRVVAPASWSDELRREFEANQANGCVGQLLLSETTRVRVWSIRLKPGERIGFHRHVLDYFWTAVTGGTSLSNCHDGRRLETSYQPGDTRHFRFGAGQFTVHDLTNTGSEPLLFTTVEFMDGANAPLPVPDHVRSRPETALFPLSQSL
jgi:hypothetical protein